MILELTKKKMQAALDHLKTELRGLRTNRANTAMVEHVMVDVWGSKMRLMEVAGISIPEPRLILITPYDMTTLHACAKGIELANLNLQTIVDANAIRIKIPEMDAQTRKDIAKQAKKKAEDAKISIRNIRREANDAVKKSKDVPEDMAKKLEKNIQELTDKSCKQADEMAAEKEKEILTL